MKATTNPNAPPLREKSIPPKPVLKKEANPELEEKDYDEAVKQRLLEEEKFERPKADEVAVQEAIVANETFDRLERQVDQNLQDGVSNKSELPPITGLKINPSLIDYTNPFNFLINVPMAVPIKKQLDFIYKNGYKLVTAYFDNVNQYVHFIFSK